MIEEDSVYAIKFAVMQHQINEKDKRIKELEDRCKEHQVLLISANNDLENSIPKQKVKEELERAEKENKPYEEYEIESRMFWINQGKIRLAKKLLEDK